MDIWITPEEWKDGISDLPAMKISTQNYIRSKKRIKYTKNGRSVIYKLSWIKDYYQNNIIDVEPKAN